MSQQNYKSLGFRHTVNALLVLSSLFARAGATEPPQKALRNSRAELTDLPKQAPILLAQEAGLENVTDDETRTASSHPGDLPPVPTSAATSVKPAAAAASTDPNAYIIGEQDSLMITVWKEKELSGSVVVRPDGKITVPLVGEVKAIGMTPVQLQSLLSEKLKPFVTMPQVTVSVSDIRSRKVYLVGHAAREGAFNVNSSTTALQIIAQAGGLKDFAKRKKIYILRQQGAEQVRYSFNYDEVIKGKKQEQNILLQPGDTIVVP